MAGIGIRRSTFALLATTALTAPFSASPASAQNLPTGASVVAGSVSIAQPSATQLTVTQSSPSAVVNYQSFSVGQGNSVTFVQPNASAAILNRVTGNASSSIAGSINANGSVYLVNPNGIAITKSGTVNAGGGFVASTLGISDSDFMAGKRSFTGTGASARVSNAGTISVGRGGYAALIGGTVSNSGNINVPLGKVGLGSGEQATLDFAGDGFLQVAMTTRTRTKGALVRNSGRIKADGGSVILTAATAREAARNAINISGTIQARSIGGHNGSITIGGGAGGRVRITGRLDASSRHRSGGRIVVTGRDIKLKGAVVDASGKTGGGMINIGGGRQGQGSLQRADTVSIDDKTTIKADATQRGNGGNVVVWSNNLTTFAGTISAKGGAQSGNGGEAEVSGKAKLAYTGFTNLTAANGSFGNLLLDPYNVTISNGADSHQTGLTATGNDSVINATTLLTALGSANVIVSTGTSGAQAGIIMLAASTPLLWSTGATLILQAAGGIALNSAINAGAGGLTLTASGTITATDAVSVARFTLTAGDWVQNAAALPAFATADFQINGGSFLRTTGGDGSTATPYLLTDIYGVQGIGTSATYLVASYKLANDIDATGTATWNGGAGFSPIGNNTTLFSGHLDGASHTLTGLTINLPTQINVGLIGLLRSTGSVTNLGLIGSSVTGENEVGGLVGYNSGTVSRSYAVGSVKGVYSVGGLVGSNNPGGTISQAYGDGGVSGYQYVGGLVGLNGGTTSQAYATGSVSGVSDVGGLVGLNSGTMTQTYASGRVSASGSNVGGLVGNKTGTGTIAASYFDIGTTGQSSAAGFSFGGSVNMTGLNSAQARSQSGYTNAGDPTQNFDFTNVWYQAGDMRPILRSEAAAPVGGVIPISNLHQLQLMGANLAGSYVLTRNIDASATGSISTTANPSDIFGAGGFVPVGDSTTPFTGSLNGASQTISGLTINRPGESDVGLFGYLDSTATVSGVGLTAGNVLGGADVGMLAGFSEGSIAQSYATGSVRAVGTYTAGDAGGLVGQTYGGRINQSYANVTVTGAERAGGLVGSLGGGSITQSYAAGDVTARLFYSNTAAGGLVGIVVGNATISQSYATGSATAMPGGANGSRAGGLIGASLLSNVVQSYATGRVSAGTAGGLVGDNTDGFGSNDNSAIFTASYWDKDTTGQANAVGAGTSAGAIGLSASALNPRSASSYTGFDFNSVWYQAGDMRPILRSEAATAVNGVIPVSNLHQLQLMGSNLAGNYRLANDIDASATNSTVTAAGIWGAGGFVSVGAESFRFTGSLDGARHTISGLTVAGTTANQAVGLIGSLDSSASVSGIGLLGVNVSGSGDFSSVGSLVGINRGRISLSYASGVVASGSRSSVGGLVGRNYGTIDQSTASGSVSGSFSNLGGLVGFNFGGGIVKQSYATASAISYGPGAAGGLVGYNGGSISQSYAVGRVGGAGTVGGIAGGNDDDNGATIRATYWDKTTTGQNVGAYTSPTGAKGKTTAQMTDLANFRTNFAGFDFANVWSPPNQVGQSGQTAAYYPQLYALSRVLTVTPNTARSYGDSNPSLIANYTGLNAGDFVTTPGSLNTSTTAASTVGHYAATASGSAVTTSGASYRVLYVPGTLTITQRPVTVTADAQSRVYGDANRPLTYTPTALGAGVALSGMLATAATASSDVGSAPITQGTLTAAANPNYSLTYIGSTLTITQRPVTVTADAQSRVYGDANRPLTYTPTSLGAGVALSGMLATAATASSDVGSAPITQGTLTAAANPNYSLTYIGSTLTITQRPIVVVADPQTRAYATFNPALTYTVGGRGLVNGDTLEGGLSVAADAASGLGAYPINVGTLAASSNYSVRYQAALLTIVPSVALVDAGAIASRVVSDNVDWIALPDEAKPLVGLPAVATTLGVGIFYSDPRFDGVLVCFGGDGGAARSCFAASSPR